MRKAIAAAVFATTAFVAAAATPLDESIAKGVKFLLANQREDGHFSDPQMPALTALPLWALSGSGDAGEADDD